MVRLDKIYTRGGDTGETSLAGGDRVAKHDPRVETLGTVDEANALIGVARLHVSEALSPHLSAIQNDLFDLGADLATPGADAEGALRVTVGQVERLETEIDLFNEQLEPLTSFILPGGTEAAAYLHLARTVIRRSERLATALAKAEDINPEVIRYLNRLSDLLFVLARTANDQGRADVLWIPGSNR